MLSLKLIRDETERVRQMLADRGTTAPIDEILALDDQRRQLLVEVEGLRARRNAVSQEIGRTRERPPELIAEMRDVGSRIKALDQRLAEVDEELNQLLLFVPNMPDPSVPIGRDERDNVEVRRWGEPRSFDFQPQAHWDIGERLHGIDFARGAKLSGARSWVLCGEVALLNRALIAFMLDLHTTEHGYTEVLTPYLVRRECMIGTGQYPKFAGEYYTVDEGDLTLIPTAEVPVTNLHREEILSIEDLPIYNVAYSACFRREAGAAGRDTRGLIRVHQFEKVEMVKVVTPETSSDELERLVADAEDVLQRLGIPYRVMLLCTGDLGFTAAKTYDIEAWFPGQGRYIEISSCSNCGDFQARRANIRFRRGPSERPEFVHTLNGSGLAIGRTLAAVLENYQQADGSVIVPEALRLYMGGRTVLAPA
ncbi:MAG TPA: serine--tRNA ligase [Chloroflexota bacterium]|nr:serine--tRNA ligase [Chloroflexota bacterium]